MENEELIEKVTKLEHESDIISQRALDTWQSTQWHKDKYGNFENDPRQTAKDARRLANLTFDYWQEISKLEEQLKKEAKVKSL